MQPEDIQQKLAAMPNAERNQMLAMLKLMSAPPETLLNLFERLQMPWERKNIEGYPKGALVIDWEQFAKAEATNQEQGPIMKRVLTEEFGGRATQKQIGDVVREMRPEPFNPNTIQAPEA